MIVSYKIQDFFESPIKVGEFHINKLEEMPPLPKSIKNPHKHQFVEVFLLLNGSMEHNVDLNQFKIKKANLFFISKGQYHFWSKTNVEKLCGYRLMFEEGFIQNSFIQQNFLFELVYLNNIYQNPLMPFSIKKDKRLIQLFDLIFNEYYNDNFNVKALQANLFLLLLEIQRVADSNNSSTGNTYHLQKYQSFNALVEINFFENKNVSWYASQLNISQVQLNRIVSKFSNTAIGQFIQNRRILEAKRLIVTTSKSMQEISFDIGYEDPSYFIRIFKKNENCTPQEFRNKM